jgi:large subunit ribosomal protein L17
MHRHGYKGKKFGRERDQRRALIKGLANSLVLEESIETTLPKAKEIVGYTEKLITKAKIGDLHNRRLIMTKLATKEAANKLVDELAPKLSGRTSGYLRVRKTTARRGDNTMMARVSFVDDLTAKAKPTAKAEVKAETKTAAKPAAKKPVAKKPVEKK